MCELLGAALDAAVARVLSIPGLVIRPNGQPAYEFEWDPEAHCNEDDMGAWKMWRWFTPSTDGGLAMALQAEHNVCVVPVNYATPGGEWRAGFYLSYDDLDGWEAEHEARGPTPAIAICRALVRRADETAQWAAAAVENARLRVIFDRAHNRVWTLLTERQPTLVFESDEDQEAYSALVEIARDRAAIRTAPEWMTPFLQVSREIGWSAPILTIGPVGKLAIKAEPS